MKDRNAHIIQRQSIEIEFENPDDTFGLQNRIAEVFYEKLQPRMEVLFDELFGKNYYASIDKLEIDCGLLNKKNWEQEFTDQAIRRLKEELVQADKKEIDLNKTQEAIASETFFFFLEYGFLPWNKRIDSIAELEHLLIIDKSLVSQLKKSIDQKPKVAERLAFQFSKKFTSDIIAAITRNRKNELDGILTLLEKLIPLKIDNKIDRHIVDAAILRVFASDKTKSSELQFFSFLLAKIDGDSELKSEIGEIVKTLGIKEERNSLTNEESKREPSGTTEKDKEEPDKEMKNKVERNEKEDEKPHEAIYINNAGLILLHPFLPTLFEHLKLTEENRWIDEDSQLKAVLISEFLTIGNDEFEEFNLMLNKIICGVNIDEVVATDLQPDDVIKNECEILLNEVITQWSILRNTSIDGLRETFLQRNGKLSKIDSGWLLQVEQKALDVLLSHLPWGISLIKLPWMNEMISVEWT